MHPAKRLLLIGLVTALCDGTFATVQSIFVNGSATRVWQGVASVLLGRGAIGGGAAATAAGLLMHFGVAYSWSALFLLAFTQLESLRLTTASRIGLLVIAAIYGPLIWIVMSFGVIPLLVHHPPVITSRWWVQLVGHVFFVGLPIVLTTAMTAAPATSHVVVAAEV
jgi:hypothetical protein